MKIIQCNCLRSYSPGHPLRNQLLCGLHPDPDTTHATLFRVPSWILRMLSRPFHKYVDLKNPNIEPRNLFLTGSGIRNNFKNRISNVQNHSFRPLSGVSLNPIVLNFGLRISSLWWNKSPMFNAVIRKRIYKTVYFSNDPHKTLESMSRGTDVSFGCRHQRTSEFSVKH